MTKELKNFEENYLISDKGEIINKKTNKVLKQHLTMNGYLFVALYKDKVKYQKKVHRLVAETFIENPNNFPFVNHKDENKTNNSVENLEWCTSDYNNKYGSRLKKCSEKLLNREDQSKLVLQYDLNNNLINTFPSLAEAERVLQIPKAKSNITRCCNGIYNTAYGFKWKFI